MFFKAETDKRKTHRADVRFALTYGSAAPATNSREAAAQTSDLSEGGMAFTTRTKFAPYTSLSLNIHLPVSPEPVHVTGTVLESTELNPHYIYFTRVIFSEMDEQKRRAIQQTVAYYYRKNRLQNRILPHG